ncbi:MAG: hypothetical protein IH597_17055 [Bacteroidales bacterium]|nr:hypothetical protein [Bacteroidales bacterium]
MTNKKLAIHHKPGSFSEKWIEYCECNNISYKIVNCYHTDILKHLQDCDGLMWHWYHSDYKAIRFARQLIYSIEHSGKKVFPDSKTCWHFDDKVGQKYLLESIGAPLVNTHVFYDKNEALAWADSASYPKVFKLRGGAGSLNVKLVKTKSEASKLIHKAFGKGFNLFARQEKIIDRWQKFKRNKNCDTFLALLRGLALFVYPGLSVDSRYSVKEKGYVYFQDFIPANSHDIRVIVIGTRAFAIKRMVREGGFKASGSGMIIHDNSQIPIECIKLAFVMNGQLKSQCTAFDFVFDNGIIKLLEISYGFSAQGYFDCPGYWDEKLVWHNGKFTSEFFMIEDFIKSTTQDLAGQG